MKAPFAGQWALFLGDLVLVVESFEQPVGFAYELTEHKSM